MIGGVIGTGGTRGIEADAGAAARGNAVDSCGAFVPPPQPDRIVIQITIHGRFLGSQR